MGIPWWVDGLWVDVWEDTCMNEWVVVLGRKMNIDEWIQWG